MRGRQDLHGREALVAAAKTHLSVDGEVSKATCEVVAGGCLTPPVLLRPWRRVGKATHLERR